MGAANSNLSRCIEDEFHRLVKQGRDYLVVDEVLALRLPPSSWSVDTAHLGVLFALDSNRDGRFTLAEMAAFVELARARCRTYAPYEFQAQFQGYCTILFAKWAASPEAGPDAVVDWVSRLLEENMPTRTFEQHPGHTYLSRDTVETMYNIFNVQETQGMGFQEFLDLLQRAGEEAGLMEPGTAELDDWVPAAAVRSCVASLARGLLAVMAATFPAELGELLL